MTNTAGQNGSGVVGASDEAPMDLPRWDAAVHRLLRRAARPGWYGTIRIEVTDGAVRRILVERSIKDPESISSI